MWWRSARPTSAGTGTTGTPAIRQPVTANTVAAVGVASTATRVAPLTRSATDVAAPTKSPRLSDMPPIRTASARSGPARSEASNTPARLPAAILADVEHIECVNSREVYRNPWMVLREDDVRRPDGTLGIYGVIDKPDYALVMPYDGERFALVEQFRYPVGARRWEFPQGTAPDLAHVDPDELAHRELREETGLRASALERLGRLDVAPGISSQRGWVFLATGISEGDAEPEHEEQDLRSAWFTRADVERMIRCGEIVDAQSVAAFTMFLLR